MARNSRKTSNASARKAGTGKKNKWVAGVLNFVAPGAGYWYAGTKRKTFAIALTAVMIFSYFAEFFDPSKYSNSMLLWGLLMSAVFAWDAYKDVEEKE